MEGKKRRRYTEAEEVAAYMSLNATEKRLYHAARAKNHNDAKSLTVVLGRSWFRRDGTAKGSRGGKRKKIKKKK